MGESTAAKGAVGTQTNSAAIGARIKVTITGPGGRRSIYRTVTSGTRQVFTRVGKNRTIEVRENAERPTEVRRPAQRLGR